MYLVSQIREQDVSCSVRGGKKGILHGVSGKASAGRLLAVMGPSGSGKTTFLNALAGQVRERIHGVVISNGNIVVLFVVVVAPEMFCAVRFRR